MARKGTFQDQNFIVFENPPEDMAGVVENDLFGGSVARRCTEMSFCL